MSQDNITPLPVVRVEQFDGSHQHPTIRGLWDLVDALLVIIERYRTETPLGHQPHMIAADADAAIAKATALKTADRG